MYLFSHEQLIHGIISFALNVSLCTLCLIGLLGASHWLGIYFLLVCSRTASPNQRIRIVFSTESPTVSLLCLQVFTQKSKTNSSRLWSLIMIWNNFKSIKIDLFNTWLVAVGDKISIWELVFSCITTRYKKWVVLKYSNISMYRTGRRLDLYIFWYIG